MSHNEWRVEKQRGGQSGAPIAQLSPGAGMMGHMNTSSRAPTGPNSRRSGMQGVGYNGGPYPPDKDPFFGQNYPVQFGSEGPEASRYRDERSFQPPPFIDDVDMRNIWYSPMEPVWPYGPPYYTRPREWNFPVGYNLNYIQPRMELMGQLRAMRASWGIISTVEATRQDQLLRLPWAIQRKDKPKQSSKTVDSLYKFFRRPDGKLTYSQWSRKLMFDLFDIDSPYIYIDRGLTNTPQRVEVLDGATIFPLIDDAGRRPTTEYKLTPDGLVYEHRQPAYQQIIYGLPMINLSEDELIYAMMRPQPFSPMFGYSPVEQIMVEATEGIRKTFYQGEFWRAGSMPELIVTVPDNWNPKQIVMFQAHFDALLSGQLSLKSKVRFVPGGMKPFDIKNASGESLWSQRDEFLARLVCFAFSIPPTPFVRQTNRGTAQNAQQTAQEEGLYPLMSWWKDDIMDTIIQEKLGYDDIEFVFLPRPEVDLLKQAQIHQIKVHSGEMTLDEARDENGEEPYPDGLGATPLVYFGAGAVKLEDILSGEAIMPGTPPQDNSSDKKVPSSPSPVANSPQRGPAKPHAASPQGKKLFKGKLYDEITSAANDAREPTKDQKDSGNYRKGHIRLYGLDISIETPKGENRRGKNPDGSHWNSTMAGHYGYIRGTIGADGDQIDICIGKHPKSDVVFVIDQINDGTGEFDEHKVFLGYRKPEAALRDYTDSNGDGLGPLRADAMVQLSVREFKSWLNSGKTRTTPIADSGYGTRIGSDEFWGKSDTISQSTGHVWYDQGRRGKKKKKPSRLRSGPRWLELKAQANE